MKKQIDLLNEAEVMDMHLDQLKSLVDVLGSYVAQEEDDNHANIGNALDYVSWSIGQLRHAYSKPMIVEMLAQVKRNDE